MGLDHRGVDLRWGAVCGVASGFRSGYLYEALFAHQVDSGLSDVDVPVRCHVHRDVDGIAKRVLAVFEVELQFEGAEAIYYELASLGA